jgi:DNA invertase Pin-like site-specific DNA recombinase
MKTINVFAYLRVSDTSQVDKKGKPKDGFPRQLQSCQEYASHHDMKIVKIYREDITGTEYDRPVWQRLLDSLEKNHHGVKTVIIEKMDRLARDLMVQETIVAELQTRGFSLISAMEGADLLSEDFSRVMIRQLFGVVAQYNKANLVWRLKASRDRMREKTGRCEGRKGYKGTEEGQALVQRIKSLYQRDNKGKRKTHEQIADLLNKEGTLTINRRKWNARGVRKIIIS